MKLDLPALARVLLASIFVVTSLMSLTSATAFSKFSGMIASKGIPFPAVVALVALLVKLVAGTSLAVGYQVKWAAMALIAFLVVATALFHTTADELTTALRNGAIIGGLVLLL